MPEPVSDAIRSIRIFSKVMLIMRNHLSGGKYALQGTFWTCL